MLFTGDPAPSTETVSIWNRDIAWKLSSTDPRHLSETRGAVAEMNTLLNSVPFKLVEAKSAPPVLLIAFVPAAQLRNLKTGRTAFRPGRLGHTFTFRGADGAIGNAGIFIADNLPDDARKYALRHELMHAMGIPKHTTYSFKSVLRRNWQMSSAPRNLLPFDRKVIDFVYRHLKSGQTRQVVRRIFQERWRD